MGKISLRHLERKAYVYVRQSSLAQVHHHRESAARQYNLQARAVDLGWRDEQVEVIDEDQGESGASSEHRDGFKRLVSEVALGQVGAVLGLEVSRLARSCTDWYRLLEVAALSGTLIVDADGVYDPNHYNDRLLLGLKGTMSEAELHFLKQRMVGARRHKAKRGEFRIRLPVGYVWEEEGIRLDPEERVRDTLRLFFRCFDRLNTALGVARYFEEHRQVFPRRDGWGTVGFGVTWGVLSLSRAVNALRNPVYAGIYAYDRHSAKEVDAEDPVWGGRVWIENSHEGYITVEQYERHLAQLVSNRSVYRGMRNKGSAREGRSLLQGIVLCAECGRPMNVAYRRDGSCDFSCRDSHTNRTCRTIPGRDVESLVEKVVLAAVVREELELAAGALEKVAERAAELDLQWQKRIESARYEAERAARRYYAVEPENRQVVRRLEREWNDRLEEVKRLEEEYEEVKRKPPLALTSEQREKILALSQDLPRLWNAPTTKNSQRKQVFRLLIDDITLRRRDEPWSIEVAIRWKTGVVTRHEAVRRVPHPHTTAAHTVSRVQELMEGKTDGEIATTLAQEGYRTGRGKPFDARSVCSLRKSRGLMKRRTDQNQEGGSRSDARQDTPQVGGSGSELQS